MRRRKTITVRDDLHEFLRAESFVRRKSMNALLDEIVEEHYEMEREPMRKRDDGEAWISEKD